MSSAILAVPDVARRYDRARRNETLAAVAAVRRQWRRVGNDFDAGWDMVRPQVAAITVTAQRRIARLSNEYVPDVLAATGQARAAAVEADLALDALVGVTGSGSDLASSLGVVTVRAKQAVSAGATASQASAQAGRWLNAAVGTALADTARAVVGLGGYARGTSGYVRMIDPPACSRCVILAGKFFRWNSGFERHPGCNCVHIPASESVAGDVRTNPTAYFDSLSADEQDRIFGKAGAEAIRDGADPTKVVNARRGMYRAQRFGVNQNGIYVAVERSSTGRLFATEGVTVRGDAFRSLNERYLDPAGPVRTRIGGGRRYSRATTVRMMPETIYTTARTRDEAMRLLRLHGYIL